MIMRFINPFSSQLPLESQQKTYNSYDECEVREDVKLEEFSSNPLWTAMRKQNCGWRAGLTIGMLADGTVVVTVLIFTLLAAFHFSRDGLQATLIYGSCSKIKSYGTWLHFLINILSTAVLASSNYAMQCTASPTRVEVDRAHAQGKYMSIGIPNIRNIFHIRRHRALLFLLTLLSSLPIHLFANSLIFETQATDSYVLAVVYQQFLDTPTTALNDGYAYKMNSYDSVRDVIGGAPLGSPLEDVDSGRNFTSRLKSIVPSMTRLENSDCIRAYSNPLLSGRRHVLAVTQDAPPAQTNSSNFNFISQVYYQSVDICPTCQTYFNYTDPTIWTCAFTAPGQFVRGCDSSKALSQSQNFKIVGEKIAYCLSETVEERCKLQTDIRVSIILLAFTFAKLCMLWIILRNLPDQILATMGDAVSSFLRTPDPTTEGCCLLNRRDVNGRVTNSDDSRPLPLVITNRSWSPGNPFPKQWTHHSLDARWSAGPRTRQWWIISILFLIVIIISANLLGTGIGRLKSHSGLQGSNTAGVTMPPTDAAGLWRMGFGAVNVNFLLKLTDMSYRSDMLNHILLVNTPQLLLSLFYFAYNSAWTSMLIAREWAAFGRRRFGLRVSGQPEGDQRSNYFLTIPYSFAIPLQIASALLHWLLSQTFFLANVDVYSGQPLVNRDVSIINTVGYSLAALILFITLWGILFIALVAASQLGRLKSPMPIVTGNSLAMSAACHPPPLPIEHGNKRLMWGVIDEMEHDGVRHCSFSAGGVYSPEILLQEKKSDGRLVLEDQFA